MANFSTSWILNLVDNVSAPLQSVQGVSDTAAVAVNRVGDANVKVATTGTAAATATTASGTAAGFATGMFRTLSTTLLPLIGIGAALATLTGSLKAFDKQAKAEAQLMATLESTNNSAGRSFEELADQASALQGITLFGDEATMEVQAMMLTFKNVSGEIYDRSIPAIQDMATLMKTDMKSASLMVGKALNDPLLGMTSLQRAGITFSESQKDVIKSLVASGDVAQAQTLILAELESQFGGSAEAARDAGTGMLVAMSNSWGDVQETIGKLIYGIIDIVEPVVFGIINAFATLFNFIDKHSEIFKALAIGAIVTATAFGVHTAATWLLSGGFATLGKVALAAGKKIAIAMGLANPLVWIAAAIAAIVALGVYLWNTSEKFRSILFGMWEAVKTIFTSMGGFIGDTLSAVWTMIKNVFNPANWFSSDYSFTADLQKIANIASDYGERIGKSFEEGKQKGSDSFQASQQKKEDKKQVGRYPGAITAADLLSEDGQNGAVGATGGKGSGSADGGQKGLSLSGSGSGGGKSITMNLTMNNYFSGASTNDADVIARRINDRLSDALAAI